MRKRGFVIWAVVVTTVVALVVWAYKKYIVGSDKRGDDTIGV